MRNAILFILTGLFALFTVSPLMAQPAETEMADIMRSNGKIYVVVAVLATILAGLILYLVSLDRRIRRMERNID
jgi:uncharacterized membrane protein